MAAAGPGVTCGSCFLECPARRRDGRWKFPCDDGVRAMSEAARALDRYDLDAEGLAQIMMELGGADAARIAETLDLGSRGIFPGP